MLDFNGISFHWLGHDGYKIIACGKAIIYIDPVPALQAAPGQE